MCGLLHVVDEWVNRYRWWKQGPKYAGCCLAGVYTSVRKYMLCRPEAEHKLRQRLIGDIDDLSPLLAGKNLYVIGCG